MRAVRRPYGHNKHINAIWRARDAVKVEQERAIRGDDVFFTVGTMVYEVEV